MNTIKRLTSLQFAFAASLFCIISCQKETGTGANSSAGDIAGSKKSIYEFQAKLPDGGFLSFADFKGKPILLVNTNLNCGFAPMQLSELQSLYDKYADKGLVIVALPTSDFERGAPAADTRGQQDMKARYKVSFPVLSTTKGTGAAKDPIFQFLTENPDAGLRGNLTWNYEKFLLDRSGKLVARFPPTMKPSDPTVNNKIRAVL